ncbi:YycH family regulatory protein [Bacillus marasmi]|uniref:YycH family regulatory protein n=1 Tax=Bacillus marasmi TaxID=1926279 RepID=UPI0011C9401D|nr:two-component system activity regulator YycH [Bacillus marasmi]
MTYENIKSVILTILVITSVVLTWNLWTYQPRYATMENTNTVQEVILSEAKEVEEIIQPNKIIYHLKDSHFGTTSSDEIDQTLQEVFRWNFYDFEEITEEVGKLTDFVHAKGNVEIIFPDAVPIELYKSIIHVEDKKIPNFQFNRIVIDIENTVKNEGNIYFVNYGNPRDYQVFSSHINGEDLKKFDHQFYRVSNQYENYISYQVTEERTLFLPEKNKTLIHYQYFLDQLDPEKFKDAIFNDPSYVQRNDDGNTVEYIDDSSMLTVNYDSLTLSYVIPAEKSDGAVPTKDLLKKGINYVNEHGGWTGNYKYAAVDEENQQIKFRLYDRSGYPIFNDLGLSQIVQIWGKNDIYKYNRPIFSLDVPLTTDKKEVTLLSSSEVIEYLKSKKGFKPEMLKDIAIGYKMSIDPNEPQLMNLEPAWYYQYGNLWVQVVQKDVGGNSNGLE